MRNKQKLNINQWSKADRSYEEMMAKGAGILSNAELLGILTGSDNTEENAVELMRRVLASYDNNLNELRKWEIRDSSLFRDMGPAENPTIMVALELGKRRKPQEGKEREQVRYLEDIYRLFHPLVCGLLQEELWILLLNQACKVISRLHINTRGTDGAYTDVYAILREALMGHATQIALIHNHPPDNARPSQEDKRLTAATQKVP